jgi:3'-phosphoadenosine 5'-phosphosulfate sulfotransferase (PAPS reductase)/FAD synthetase
VVSISGGKDSTAMWLHLKHERGIENLIPIFADTGWEHPLTYEYLDYLETAIGPLVRVKPDLDFVELAKKKKRFPSTKARFCTENLKMKPAKAWLEAQFAAGSLVRENTIQCSGVRHEESPARAKMAEFVELDDYNKLPQWRPIIAWTWQEVFAIHDRYGVKANPLYSMGMSRVGCMPCIMANLGEVAEIARRFPDVVEKVERAEAVFGDAECPSSFFAPDTIPERFRSKTWKNPKSGEVHKVGSARDVFEYAKLEKPERRFGGKMTPLFHEPENEDIGTCSSIYGLCE